MLEFLVVLEFNCHSTADIVVSCVDWQLNNVFVGVFYLPELIAASRVESGLECGSSTKSEQRGDLILS
jgi:hypothetical protein